MKNIVMLSAALAVVSVPQCLCASNNIKIGPSGACVVDSTLNYQRFYYCGKQESGCAGENHNDNDYYVCNNGTEQRTECFISHNTKFTTVGGQTYYCCNGTANTMGKVQDAPCQNTGGLNVVHEPATPSLLGELVANILKTALSETTTDAANQTDTPSSAGITSPQNGHQVVGECDTSDIRNGFCPSTNGCVKCPTGKYFNEKDSANGCCSYAIALTKTDMMYGYGKTQNSNTRLRNQCWTIKDPARYRACVLSGAQKPTIIKAPIQSATATAVTNTVSAK